MTNTNNNSWLFLALLLSSLLVLIKVLLVDFAIHNFLFPLWTGLLIWYNFDYQVITID